MIKRIVSLFFYYVLSPLVYARYLGVSVGHNCRIVTRNWGSEPYLIDIGNHVHITKDVSFLSHGLFGY